MLESRKKSFRRFEFTRTSMAAAVAMLALSASAKTAHALGGPAPGAVSAQTVKLPSGPGSIRGLAEDAKVSSFTGQVQYSVPVELPAGPGGFAPSLSFSYAGELGNGPLGVGWNLSQAGVRRSTRLGVPTYDSTDELEIVGLGNGGELVRLADGSYRLEGQGHSAQGELVPDGTSNGFVLTAADGTIYRLGLSASARKASASGAQVAFWYLQEVQNVAGQTIEYRYAQAGGEVYLSEVLWGPSIAGVRAFRAEMIYEDRSDAVVSYRTGFRVESAKRLDKIKVWSYGGVQRIVDLSYETNFAISRLSQVKVTSADGLDALPPVTFQYATASGAAVQTMADTNGWALNASGTSLFDVDDDGVMDLLRLTSTGHTYRRNLGDRFDVARPVPGADGATLNNVRLLDLTGDSGAEMVWQQGTQWKVFQLGGATALDKSWTALGNWAGAQNLTLSSVAVADLDGDYRMDVLQASGTSNILVRAGTEAGLAASVRLGAIDPVRTYVAPGNSATSFPDVNGDGLADAVYLASGAMYLYLGKGDGTFEKYKDVAYPWTGTIDLSQIRLGDLDRDGLMDLSLVSAGNVAWYRGQANGTVSTTPVNLARPPGTDGSVVVAVADANGNGSEDLVWSSTAGMWVLDFAGPTSAGMLTGIQNGLGQTQTFSYSASAQLALSAAAAGNPWTLGMPISIPVTSKQRRTFASGEPARSVRLDVRDGIYDRGERRFVGFAEAIVTRPDPADGLPASQTVRQVQRFSAGPGLDRELRGQLLSDRVEDGAGVVLRETTYDATTMAVSGLPATEPKLRRAIVRSVEEKHYEGQPSALVMRTEFAFDAEGRQIEEKRFGRLDLTGDESLVRRTYTSGRSTRGVRDQICEEKLYELPASGPEVLISHAQVLFGDAATTAPLCDASTGWERERRQYLTSEARWVTLKSASFDAFGNRVQTMADGVSRGVEYDANGQNPIAEIVKPSLARTLRWEMSWNDVLSQPTQVRDAGGVFVNLGYDGLGRIRSMARAGNAAHLEYRYHDSGPRPYTETFTFDGAIDAVTAVPASWTPASKWRHSVAVLTSAGEPMFSATRLDVAKWLVTERRSRDALGRTTAMADAYEFSGTLAELVASSLPGAVPVQTLSYDALDRVTLQTLASGAKNAYSYRAFEATSAVDGMAPVTRYADGQGRVRRSVRVVGGVEESVDATFDAGGRITKMRLPTASGAVEHVYTYDSLGRLTLATDPDIGERRLAYDDGGHLTAHTNGANQTTRYTYDGAGRLASTTGSDGLAYVFHYDDALDAATFGNTASRLAWVEEPTGSVQLGYDAFGQQVRMRRTVSGQSADQILKKAASGLVLEHDDGDGLAFTVGYDAAGRASGLTMAGTSLWTMENQDAAGRPLRERFGNGVVQTYARNVLGQADQLRVLRPSSATLYGVDLTYNPYGALATMTDVDGRGLDHNATFTYDGGARLTDATMGTGAGAFQMRYRYDGLQNMVRREAVGPRALGISLGQYRYGEPATVGGPARGPRQLTSIVADVAAGSPAGTPTLTFDYDGAGRTTRQGAMTLAYNGFDQLTSVSGVAQPGGGTGSVTHAYGYDGLRVRSVGLAGDQTLWFSSEVSQTQDGTRQYDVRIGERLIARISRSPAALAAAEREAKIVGGAALARNVWRGLGLAGGLFLLGVIAMSFARRGGRRARPALVWRLRLRAVAVGLTLVSFVLSGCNAQSFLSASEDTAPLRNTSRVLYYHQGVGAGPALITNSDGSLFEERRYEPYGAPMDSFRELAGGGTQSGPIDFARDPHNSLNKQTDAATGWSDHGARWMAPEIGRWQTPDPPVKAPDASFMNSPWNLHPYQYVNQNPVLYWDPDGRDKIKIPGVGTDLLESKGSSWLSGYQLSPAAQAALGPIFERAWNFDVSKVTVHFGPVGKLGAAAMTFGNTVIVDRGQWNAATQQERLALLAHEITHSVQYERLSTPGSLAVGGTISVAGIVSAAAAGLARKIDDDNDGIVAGIISGLLTVVASSWFMSKASLLWRYKGEFKRDDNYNPPQELLDTKLEDVDPIDKKYTLDQISERTAAEVNNLAEPEPETK